MWPPIQKMKRILVTSNATTTYRDYVNRYSYINRYIPLPKAKGNQSKYSSNLVDKLSTLEVN